MKKEKVKEKVKTFLIIACIYLLFILFLLFYTVRIEKLDQNSYTEAGKNKTLSITIKK